MKCHSPLSLYSQTRKVRERKKNGDHPVDEMGRLYILVCCFFCSTTVSVTYAFDLFTTPFQSMFGLSSGDLTTVSTVGLVFCYFTIPYSLIFENLGPYLLFWICCLCALIGGLCLALTIEGKIPGNTAVLSVFYAFLNIASGLVDTAYVSVLVELFPRNRGPVIALAKVMTSLGSSTLSCINTSFFGNNISGFIYFLMAFVMAVDIWASFTVVLPPYYMNWWRRRGKTEEEIFELRITEPYYERKSVPLPRLIIGYVLIIALIIFYAVEAPVVKYADHVSNGAQIAIGVIGVVLVLLIFLMLLPFPFLGGMHEKAPQGIEKRRIEGEFRRLYAQQLACTAPPSNEAPQWLQDDSVDTVNDLVKAGPTGKVLDPEIRQLDSQSSLGDSAAPDENSGGAINDALASSPQLAEEGPDSVEVHDSRQDPRYQGTFLDYLCNVDLWLILLLFVFYGATGTLVLYNSSTISIAANGFERSEQLSALYTAFLGIGSAVGRIAFGLFEAYVQHQKPGHRKVIITMALPFSPLLSFLGALFILVLPGKAILFPFLLVYLEEGVFAGVNALIFPCLFENNHNSLYNVSFLVQCITTICYNRLMLGIYIDKQEKHYRANGRIPATKVGCTIPECIRVPMIIGCVFGFCGIFVALMIHFRYKMFINRVLKAKEHARANGIPYELGDGSSVLSRWIRAKLALRKLAKKQRQQQQQQQQESVSGLTEMANVESDEPQRVE